MTSDPYAGEKGRWGTIHRVVSCVELVQVHMEWLCDSEVDWVVTIVCSTVKPLAPTSIVQTQEFEQPICNLDLPSIRDCECKESIYPVCGYSNSFRPDISSPLEEVGEIFYTIKPWGYCGGVGVNWSTWLIVIGGPPQERFGQLDIIPPNRIGDCAEAYQQITVAVLNGHQEGHRLLRLDIRKSLEHTVISMDPNLYAFNRDASYPTRAGFPHNDACKDLIEAHIQFVVPEKSHGGRGDFTAEVEDIFAKYRFPHISSETVIGLWQMDPMGF